MAYAAYTDIEARLNKTFTDEEQTTCAALLDDAAVIIDAYNEDAETDNKKVVSCRMVIRAVGSIGVDMPIGANQGTVSALGYSQTWTMSSGSLGELYLTKLDKKLLSVGNVIGSHSPVEDL